jgi:hypothetical protein
MSRPVVWFRGYNEAIKFQLWLIIHYRHLMSSQEYLEVVDTILKLAIEADCTALPLDQEAVLPTTPSSNLSR